MKQSRLLMWYGALFIITFACDRITKMVAVAADWSDLQIFPFLSFDVVYNRGISWGLFHSADTFAFVLVAGATALVIGALMFVAARAFEEGRSIIGYVLTISGALGNLADRAIYGGVVDFIRFFIGDWSFAIFNCADAFITLGIALMILDTWRVDKAEQS